MPEIVVNGRKVQAGPEQPIIETIRELGIPVPTMCYHPALTPVASCKLCAVEVSLPDKPSQIRLACTYKPKERLEVRTETEGVQRARTAAFRRLVGYAPESRAIRDLAEQFGIDLGAPPDECIRCRLCIRACKEIVGIDALKLEKRGEEHYVAPREGDHCIGCATCVNLCPTGAIKMEDTEGQRLIYIRNETIGRNPLLRCEACGKLFATQKFLSKVEARTEDHPQVKEHHRYCQTCSKMLSDRIQTAKRFKRM